MKFYLKWILDRTEEEQIKVNTIIYKYSLDIIYESLNSYKYSYFDTIHVILVIRYYILK